MNLAAFRPVRSRKDALGRVVVCTRASVGVLLALWRAFTLLRVLRSCARIRARDNFSSSNSSCQIMRASSGMQRQLPLRTCMAACAALTRARFCTRSCCFCVHRRATRRVRPRALASAGLLRSRMNSFLEVLALAVAGPSRLLLVAALCCVRCSMTIRAIARPPTAPECAGAPGGLERRRGSI